MHYSYREHFNLNPCTLGAQYLTSSDLDSDPEHIRMALRGENSFSNLSEDNDTKGAERKNTPKQHLTEIIYILNSI